MLFELIQSLVLTVPSDAEQLSYNSGWSLQCGLTQQTVILLKLGQSELCFSPLCDLPFFKSTGDSHLRAQSRHIPCRTCREKTAAKESHVSQKHNITFKHTVALW